MSVKEDGGFAFPSLAADSYTLTMNPLPENFYIKAVRLRNNDATEVELDLTRGEAGTLEIVLSPDGGQVEGGVVDLNQQPANGVTVVLVPDLRRREQTRLFKTAMTDRYGHFSIKGIAPGGYKLFAFEEIEIGAYQDPGFLKRLENLGEAVSIREGSRENARIKMIPAGEAAGQNPSSSVRALVNFLDGICKLGRGDGSGMPEREVLRPANTKALPAVGMQVLRLPALLRPQLPFQVRGCANQGLLRG